MWHGVSVYVCTYVRMYGMYVCTCKYRYRNVIIVNIFPVIAALLACAVP